MLHCAQRGFWEPAFPEINGAQSLNFAGWSKTLTGAARISVGSRGLAGDFMGAFGGEGSSTAKLDKLMERMERDEFDLIAVGRALIANPGWVEKVRTGNSGALQDFGTAALGKLVQGMEDAVRCVEPSALARGTIRLGPPKRRLGPLTPDR